MSFASIVLSLMLGQNCPAPSSAWGPPPCAVANVPGCLPGYYPRFDERLGRTVYACNAGYAAPSQQALPLPQAAPPPPPPGNATPMSYPRPAVSAPPQGYSYLPGAPPQPAHSETRGHLGFVFMPGVSAYPSTTRLEQGKSEGQLALEFRGSEGGGRLRLVGTYASFGKIGEVSVKYDFLDGFFFRPFLAIGLGVASINPDPGLRGAASASGGVDLFLSRDFFLTGEVNGRIFTNGTQGNAHGLVISDQRQVSFLVGMGFYVF